MDFPGVGEIMDFSMEWLKKFFKGANSNSGEFDSINSKLTERERHVLANNLIN